MKEDSQGINVSDLVKKCEKTAATSEISGNLLQDMSSIPSDPASSVSGSKREPPGDDPNRPITLPKRRKLQEP